MPAMATTPSLPRMLSVCPLISLLTPLVSEASAPTPTAHGTASGLTLGFVCTPPRGLRGSSLQGVFALATRSLLHTVPAIGGAQALAPLTRLRPGNGPSSLPPVYS